MGNYNTDNALLVNPYKTLTHFLNAFYTNITWVIRNGPKYLKDLNMAEIF
jgi:chemotaxis methyl-accepting protein methylase